MMPKERKRKGLFEDLFEDLFSEGFDFENLNKLGGDYSISISQIGNKTQIHVKADKNVDVQKLRKELEEQYPGAEIFIEGGKITIEEEEKNQEKSTHEMQTPKPRKSLIEVIDEKKLEEE